MEFRDSLNIELVLKLFASMCEGHNFQVQNILREQPGSHVKVDMVRLSVELLHVMVEKIDSFAMPLLVQVCFTWCMTNA